MVNTDLLPEAPIILFLVELPIIVGTNSTKQCGNILLGGSHLSLKSSEADLLMNGKLDHFAPVHYDARREIKEIKSF